MMAEIPHDALYMLASKSLSMSQKAQPEIKSATRPGALESYFPFLSEIFRYQSALPAVVAAEQELLRAIVASDGVLEPDQKIRLMHAVIGAPAEPGPGSFVQSGGASTIEALGLKLSSDATSLSRHDIQHLTESGLGSSASVETISAVATAQFYLTLAKCFGFDPKWPSLAFAMQSKLPEALQDGLSGTPPIEFPLIEPDELKHSYSILREQYGFVPNLYRIQSYRPSIIEAQVRILDTLIFAEDHLSRPQKELIVLRLAALNLNTYLVEMQINILGLLGTGPEECDQVIENLECASLTPAERVLLEEIGNLRLFSASGAARIDLDRLRKHDFTESQIIEGIATTALTNCLCVIQFGLKPVPDFPPRRIFTRKDLYPSDGQSRPTFDDRFTDPDLSLVEQIKQGNAEVFAELVRRHTRRVFGTLVGMLGNSDDARDSTQDVFLKVFQNADKFQGRSKFSTWIMSIAVNTGTEILRQRRPTESLDENDDESNFRPRQIQSWVEDPEQQLAKAQRNDLVRKSVLRLPDKYRIALLLRDINQIPTDEAAAALGLSVPAFKARVLRGRLMLRESLAPHFTRTRGESNV